MAFRPRRVPSSPPRISRPRTSNSRLSPRMTSLTARRLSTPSIPCATGACRLSSAPSRLVPPSPSRARSPTICSWSRLRPRRSTSPRIRPRSFRFASPIPPWAPAPRSSWPRSTRTPRSPCSTTPAIRTARVLPTLLPSRPGRPSSTSSIPRPLRTTLPRALPTSSPRPRRPAPRSSLRRSTTRRRPFCSRTPRTWATT